MRALLPLAAASILAACGTAPAPKSPPPAKTVAKIEPVKTDPKAFDEHRQPPVMSPYAPAREDTSKRGQVVGDLYRPDIKDTVPSYIPDVDRIPEPQVRAEPRSRRGNRSYAVLGKRYTPMEDHSGFVEEGGASYYGNKFHGRLTSNEEVYDMYAFTAAHRTLPLPSYARVTNLDNGKSVVVRVNDRGPFHSNRIIDLSYAAAVKLGYREKGTARVRVEALTPAEQKQTDTAILVAAQAKTDPVARQALASAVAAGKVPEGVALTDSQSVLREEFRFDVTHSGRAMKPEEFDAWMKARGLRVATGKPGKPDVQVNVVPAVTPPVVTNAAPAPVRTTPLAAAPAAATSAATSAPVPAPTVANASATGVAPTSTPVAAGITQLQVASFANETNAQHALDIVRRAGITNARVVEGNANGRRVWRLRVAASNSAELQELSTRIAGLGFGAPNPVRD